SLESTLEGDVDLQGFLGLSDHVRPGYQAIRVTFTVRSDASPEQLRELAKFSPIYDTVTNPVPVTIHVQAK
ncbi:MAG TPA: osmotically inducible protein C, partial [Nitrospira sp.]|nr:osmotically inducible protein C [Nitrospira sp.]